MPTLAIQCRHLSTHQAGFQPWYIWQRFSCDFNVAPRWRSPMWSAQAEAEGLALLVANNKTGYFGVHLNRFPQPVRLLSL